VVITFINNGVVPEAGTTAASILSSVNFNPYIVVAQERGKEVHLANMPPSQLMNMSYFGSIDDRSVPAASNYFKSEQGLPWALNIDQSIPYTIEKTDFVNAYPNFFNWANSGGTNNTNWYTNQAGNRVSNNLIIR
jgi:LruC domain-containing protein